MINPETTNQILPLTISKHLTAERTEDIDWSVNHEQSMIDMWQYNMVI
jgi:hypothetical protein